MFSNGAGAMVKKVLQNIPTGLEIYNTSKSTAKQQHHTSYNLAPKDLKKYQNLNFGLGCELLERCGLGLTRYGYYPCGPGASVDRIFGFDIGIKNLSEADTDAFRKKLPMLCSYCGHFKENGHYADLLDMHSVNKKSTSQSWTEAYGKYKKQNPELTLY